MPLDPSLLRPARYGRRGQSLPLSLAAVCGLPRSPISRLSSRATRTPDGDVSTTSGGHRLRRTSLCACSRRPHTGCRSAGCRSRCQTRFRSDPKKGACAQLERLALVRPFEQHHRRHGASARLRPPRAEAAGSPRDESAAASCGWASCPPAPADSPSADSRTGNAQPPAHADGPAWAHYLPSSADSRSLSGSRRPDCTPYARQARDAHEQGRGRSQHRLSC